MINMSDSYIPPPLKLSRHNQLDYRYTINVVQNPIRARCCGFGEKDRRPIDPPPILELRAEDKDGNRVDLKPEDSVLFLAQCELYNVDKTENRTLVYTPWSSIPASISKDQSSNGSSKSKTNGGRPEYVRNLIGSSVSNAYHLYNEEDKPGTYFIFHDISVRTEGTFTLKFVFVNLAASEPLTMTTHIEQEVFSAPFSVYPAKKFPGLTESTSLSRCFSKQGIKIPIRNESSCKRANNTPYQQQEGEEEEQQQFYDDQQQQSAAEGENSLPPRIQYTRLPISDFLLPEE